MDRYSFFKNIINTSVRETKLKYDTFEENKKKELEELDKGKDKDEEGGGKKKKKKGDKKEEKK